MGNAGGFGQGRPAQLAEWRRAAEDLAQQAQLAWAIGLALREALVLRPTSSFPGHDGSLTI